MILWPVSVQTRWSVTSVDSAGATAGIVGRGGIVSVRAYGGYRASDHPKSGFRMDDPVFVAVLETKLLCLVTSIVDAVPMILTL